MSDIFLKFWIIKRNVPSDVLDDAQLVSAVATEADVAPKQKFKAKLTKTAVKKIVSKKLRANLYFERPLGQQQ